MWVTWHGMGARRGRQRAEACPVRGGFWLWVCELGGAESMRLTWMEACTRHNNMAQLAPWRARSSKK